MNVEQRHKKIVKLFVFIAIFVILIFGAAYAAFVNISYNTENIIVSLGNRPIFTSTSTNTIAMENIPYIADVSSSEYEIANASGNLSVALTSGYDVPTTCTYDIFWEWDILENNADGYTKTSGASKEFTVSGIADDGQFFGSDGGVQVLNYDPGDAATRLYTGKVTSSGSSMTTVTWTFTTHFFKTQAIQSGHRGKSYPGRIYVDNVMCSKASLVDYISQAAPKSGTDAVSHSPWILTSDHPGEWRYAGKNPDNYIQFNGELWRIIGVMPNMTYCEGTYGNANECNLTTTGSLVKIIRNQSISSSNLRWDYKQTGVGSSTSNYGSNDWSDSQLMLMLNGTNYLKTGYDVNGNKLHQSYTITSNVVKGNGYNYYNATYSYLDGNGQAVYVPSSATTSSYTATSGTLYKKIESTALNQIATVKWDLYGMDISYQTSSTEVFYNAERNINGLGAVYTGTTPENRPVYWYGKIGLMYLSDYGYATNGGSTYNRNTCLDYQTYFWGGGTYQTDCALNSYLLFQNITSTAPGTSGTSQWTISPVSDNVFGLLYIYSSGGMNSGIGNSTYAVRPTLYLKADTGFSGGSGTYNSPYTIN